MHKPYLRLLVLSFLITVFLFYGEYYVWDKSPGQVDAGTMLLEFLTIGSIYTLLIWGLASLLYILFKKAAHYL